MTVSELSDLKRKTEAAIHDLLRAIERESPGRVEIHGIDVVLSHEFGGTRNVVDVSLDVRVR